MKNIWTLLLLCGCAMGQTTAVTLQVTDADSQTWNNGTWSVFLYSPPGVPCCTYNIINTSTPVPNQTQSGTLSGTGGASMTLTPNGSIAPAGTQWNYQVCPQAAPAPCFTQPVLISGASQTVTLAPPGIRISGHNPVVTILAYQDLEISTPNIGLIYFNLTTSLSRQWNGTTWTSLGGGAAPVIDKGGQVYNVKAYGAVCDGSTDDFQAFMGLLGAVTSANALNGGIVLIPPNSKCIVNGQIVLNSGTTLMGSNQFTSIIKSSTSMSPNTTGIISTNFGGVNCSGSSFTNCPNNFGMSYLTYDGNCGAPNGGGNNTPCAGGGGRGTGTGDCVDWSGYRWTMEHVNIMNCPNAGFHHEISGGLLTSLYFNAGFTYDRNAATMDDVGIFLANGNGIEDFGPPDSRYDKVISESNNGANLVVSCTAGGACGGQVYYTTFHGAHSNNGDCADIFELVLFDNFQCETTQTSGKFNVNIDEGPNVGTITQNFGAMSGSVMDIGGGNFSGSGLRINSPQSTNDFVNFPLGNSITGLKSWKSGGTGITCTSLATRTYVQGTVGGNGTDLALNCPGQTFDISYAGSGTDVSIHQWKGGNISSAVCGAEINSAFSPQSAITGNAADIILVNCSIPAWANQVGHKCTYRMQFVHTGAASLTWKIWFGQTAAVGSAPSGGTNVLSFATTQAGGFFYNGEFAITSYIPPGGSTCSVAPCLLNEIDPLMSAASASLIASSSQLYSGANQTLGAAFNLSLSFNVANTDTATFKGLESVCY